MLPMHEKNRHPHVKGNAQLQLKRFTTVHRPLLRQALVLDTDTECRMHAVHSDQINRWTVRKQRTACFEETSKD